MKFFPVFLGCAQFGAGVTVAHHIKLQSDVRTSIELIPLPIGLYDFPLILSKFFSLATLVRLEMRNSGIQLDFINHNYIFLYFILFVREASSQSAPKSCTKSHKIASKCSEVVLQSPRTRSGARSSAADFTPETQRILQFYRPTSL